MQSINILTNTKHNHNKIKLVINGNLVKRVCDTFIESIKNRLNWSYYKSKYYSLYFNNTVLCIHVLGNKRSVICFLTLFLGNV
jgi:hypothetical protein